MHELIRISAGLWIASVSGPQRTRVRVFCYRVWIAQASQKCCITQPYTHKERDWDIGIDISRHITHLHTHTHTPPTYPHIQSHTHTHTYTHLYTITHTNNTHACSHTRAFTQTHMNTYNYATTNSYIYTHTHTCSPKHPHTAHNTCHAPLPKIRENGVATRVGDVYTRGKNPTYTR